MVAPTHVAIEEVLRRIGSQEGVRALRLSWDDAKVAEDVRKFTPARITDPFIEIAKALPERRQDRWEAKRRDIAQAMELLSRLRDAYTRYDLLLTKQQDAERRVERARESLASEGPILERTLATCQERIGQLDAEIARLGKELADATSHADSLWAQARWTRKIAGLIGLGQLGAARGRCRELKKRLTAQERQREELQAQHTAAAARSKTLRDSLKEAGTHLAVVSDQTRALQSEVRAGERSCREHETIGVQELNPYEVDRLLEQLRRRDRRLNGYQRLTRRFTELIAAAAKEGQDVERLRTDLLAISNLFCCTTTGVAGSPELRDLVFDALIVDEASRVTDSEFLIGAVRARQWILVGDEKQLPPYAEQHDEHLLHALSPLHRSETLEEPLEQSVNAVGGLWEEDEELHRFRRDSVLRIAQHLRDGGQWDRYYREQFQRGVEYLKKQELDNPTRELLRAMRDCPVRSLFERVVESCSNQLRVRLVEQRRMIEPIAAIVSGPIYGGQYRTPSEDDLAEHGVTPLTTPTFPTRVTFLDTSPLGKKAREELVHNSFINRVEADWIVRACVVLDRELAQANERPITVSILAFYKAQARLVREGLRTHRFPRPWFSVVDAIDRIQGQESDVVFLSFCRTCGKHVSATFGQWLQDLRRLNVACTRARRALVFVGQKELLGRLCANEPAMPFYRHLNHLFEMRPDSMRVLRQFGGVEQ